MVRGLELDGFKIPSNPNHSMKNFIFLNSCTVVIGIKELESKLWKLHMNGKSRLIFQPQQLLRFP